TGLKGSFMSIQPCVITDFSTQTIYPGVVIKGLTGVVGCLTYDELKLCATVIINNLDMLYLNSLTLMNHFILSETNSTGGNKAW
ncbi:MAG: hypothetical protein K2N99_02955, partial [Malacoplasma sp.]|nr:hypothetical protein [Malacoplasma sp.]